MEIRQISSFARPSTSGLDVFKIAGVFGTEIQDHHLLTDHWPIGVILTKKYDVP